MIKKKTKNTDKQSIFVIYEEKKNISKTHTAPDTFLIAIYSTSKNL